MGTRDKITLIAVGAILLIGILVYLLIRLLCERARKESMKIRRELDTIMSRVIALPTPEAERLARDAVARAEGMQLIARVAPTEPDASLVGSLRDFFRTYEAIELPEGRIALGQSDPVTDGTDYLYLGQIDEHVHLASPRGTECVVEIADDVDPTQNIEGRYPSIHHWLLYFLQSSASTVIG